MRSRSKSLLTLMVVLLTVSGCATIFSGTTQTIMIDSKPQGAYVELGPQSGKTPATFTLSKGKDYTIEVRLGSKKKMLALSRSFDAIGILNIFFWPGFIIDAASGAMTKYSPDTYMFRFLEESSDTEG